MNVISQIKCFSIMCSEFRQLISNISSLSGDWFSFSLNEFSQDNPKNKKSDIFIFFSTSINFFVILYSTPVNDNRVLLNKDKYQLIYLRIFQIRRITMSFMKPFCNIMSLAILLFFSGIGYTAVNIIPLPTSLTVSGGSFTLPATVIIYADDSSVATVPWLEELFKQAGLQTQIGDETSAHITIKKITNPDLGSEGYSLKITDKTIAIQAQTLTGQFYAVQSIRQLMPPEIELRDSSKVQKPIVLDQLDIVDVPRFAVRGSMLDVVRHFLPMSYLRNHVDRMALFKLNRFHIHLTDDQGWRLEIPGYDNLISVVVKTWGQLIYFSLSLRSFRISYSVLQADTSKEFLQIRF